MLAAAIPAGMKGTVHVKWFDPNNPIGSIEKPSESNKYGGSVRDNHGSIEITGGTTVTFNSLTSSNTTRLTIGDAHAGDNYIVGAHPNDGVVQRYGFGEDNGTTLVCQGGGGFMGALQTPILTVWRTLNVEIDVCTWPEMSSRDWKVPLDDFVATELAKACVVTKAFDPNPRPGIAFNKLGITTAEEMDALEEFDSNGNEISGRDIKGLCKEFWTVRIVTMPCNVNMGFYGGFLPARNGISIFYMAVYIDKIEYDWDDDELADSLRRHVLHEIGHVLSIVGDDETATEGVMKSPIDPEDTLKPQYQKFLLEDIWTIQENSKVNDKGR